MAHTPPTAADILLINDQNAADYYVTDLLEDAPFLAALYAQTASNGQQHEYIKKTGAPSVGFRAINAGRDHGRTVRSKVTVPLKFLDCSYTIDVASVAASNKIDILNRESLDSIQAGFAMAELQLLGGTVSGEAGGFSGLADALGALSNAMVISDGGAGNDLTSVYMVRTNERDCSLVLGDEGNIMVGETREQRVDKSADAESYMAYVTRIDAWMTIQTGSIWSVARLCNIEANTLTDDKLSLLRELFPASKQPNLIAMNTKARGALQRSRTATTESGRYQDLPTEHDGIPIVTTDGILNTEAAVT